MAEKYEDEFSYVQVCSRKNPCCNHSFKISMTSRATESKKSTNNTCTPTKRKSSISKKKLFILELVTVLFLLASCEWVVYLVQTTTTCISQVRYSSEAVSIMTMTNSDNFEWALRESNGFFDNIPAEEWKRLREIAHNQALAEQKAPPLQGNTRSSMLLRQASHVYQEHWDPDFSCRHDTKVGMGDGGKWVSTFVRVCIRVQYHRYECYFVYIVKLILDFFLTIITIYVRCCCRYVIRIGWKHRVKFVSEHTTTARLLLLLQQQILPPQNQDVLFILLEAKVNLSLRKHY